MKPLTVAAFGAVAFFSAFFATHLIRSETRISPAGVEDRSASIASDQAIRPDASSNRAPLPAHATGAFSIERLDAVLAEPGYLVRRVRLRTMFDALPKDGYSEVLSGIVGTSRATTECLQLFFLSWTRRDPLAASSRALQTMTGENLYVLRQVLGYWGKRDPAAAKEFAGTLPEDERKRFQGWLDQQSAKPTQTETPRRNLRDDFMRNIQIQRNGLWMGRDYQNVTLPALRRWVQADPAVAAAEILRSPMMRETRDFIRIIFEEWSKTDASAADKFFSSLTTKEQRDLMEPMAAEIAEKDPATARLLAERLPVTGNWRESVLTKVGKKVAEKDPAAAQSWIESIRHSNPSYLPMSLFGVWFKHDPKAAAKALLELPAYQEQRNNSRLVTQYLDLSDWVAKEPGPASDFLGTLPLDDLKDTLEKIGKKWIQTNPGNALDWARTLPAGPLQDEALRQFTYVWARAENRQVVAHLQSLPRGSGKSAAIEGFAFASFDTDPDQVLQWTRQIHDPAMRVDVLSRAWSDWRRKNRVGADDWVDNVAQLEPVEREALSGAR